jgi:hypothetical protein
MEVHGREPKTDTFVMSFSIIGDQFPLQQWHQNNRLHFLMETTRQKKDT